MASAAAAAAAIRSDGGDDGVSLASAEEYRAWRNGAWQCSSDGEEKSGGQQRNGMA